MNATLNGLLGPSQVLLFLEHELQLVTSLPPLAHPADEVDRRSPRRDLARARLDGEPWRPQA